MTFVKRPTIGLSLTGLIVFVAFYLPVIIAFTAPLSTIDLNYHLRAGSEILNGRIPDSDTWTFTAFGRHWTDVTWLSQVVLTLFYRFAGWPGLILLRALLIIIFSMFVYRACRMVGANRRTAALLVTAVCMTSIPVLTALRPQLIALPLLPAALLILVGRASRPLAVWLLPVLAVVWANLHGSFIVLPMLIGLAWIDDVAQKQTNPSLLIAGGLSVISTCLTPFGAANWSHALSLVSNPFVTDAVGEWLPPTIRTLEGFLFFASGLGVVIILARLNKSVPWNSLLWLTTFFTVGLWSIRGLAWWPTIAAVVLAGLLANPESPIERRDQKREHFHVFVVLVLLAIAVVLYPAWRSIDPVTGAPKGLLRFAPAGVTKALEHFAEPNARVFNPQSWGSWFEFRLPELRYAVDTRISLIPIEVWRRYNGIISGSDPTWQNTLRNWGIDFIVVRAEDESFIARLQAAGYQKLYEDAEGLIFAPIVKHSSFFDFSAAFPK